jgi:hypothetical protein
MATVLVVTVTALVNVNVDVLSIKNGKSFIKDFRGGGFN